MTLARRLTYTILALTLGLTLVALTPLWVMLGIRDSAHLAYDEFKELRLVDEVVLHLGSVLGLLHATPVDRAEVTAELGQARLALDRFMAFQADQTSEAIEHEQEELEIATRTRAQVLDLERRIASEPGETRTASPELRVGVKQAVDGLRALSDQTATGIEQSQAEVFARINKAILISGVLAAVTLTGVVSLIVFQYRGVIRPLRRLREGVRRTGAGEFSQILGIASEDEIGEVAREFDRMSSQLGSLYRNLEDKVRRASCELARSERLASVGFLAAGVAHEINNPLNIISGHAELMLRRLDGKDEEHPGRPAHDLREKLDIIREEAFRCKQIIERLLSLARPGGGDRRPIDLAGVSAEVIRNVQALQSFERARIEFDRHMDSGCTVLANDTELKQVILNLLVNAMKALPDTGGRVQVGVCRHDGQAVLTVEDNGRGMSSQTLDRVFEPFFTEGRGSTEPGTGLGLSISHAIITELGGSIRAESAGPGRGSRFTVELPLAVPAGVPA